MIKLLVISNKIMRESQNSTRKTKRM